MLTGPALRGGVLPPRLGVPRPAQGGRPGAQAVRAQRMSVALGRGPSSYRVPPWGRGRAVGVRATHRLSVDAYRTHTRRARLDSTSPGDTRMAADPSRTPSRRHGRVRTSSASAAPECRASRRSSPSAARKVAGSDAKESATAEALRGAGRDRAHRARAGAPGRRTPPASSSPAPSAPTTPSWPRAAELRHPGRAPLRRAGLPDGRRCGRSPSPAPTARPPRPRCSPSPWPSSASTRRTPSAATWTRPARTPTHGDGRDLRRRGGRERPQLPQVRRPRSRSSSTWSWTTTPTTPRWTRSTSPSRPSPAGSRPGGTLVDLRRPARAPAS